MTNVELTKTPPEFQRYGQPCVELLKRFRPWGNQPATRVHLWIFDFDPSPDDQVFVTLYRILAQESLVPGGLRIDGNATIFALKEDTSNHLRRDTGMPAMLIPIHPAEVQVFVIQPDNEGTTHNFLVNPAAETLRLN
jgi:hypothetical protein